MRTNEYDNYVDAFWSRVYAAAKYRNLTINELAAVIGKTRSCISSARTRKARPSFETVIKLSEFLDVSTDYLMKGDSVSRMRAIQIPSRIYTDSDFRDTVNKLSSLSAAKIRAIDSLISIPDDE